ncbi:C6 transcription factor [Stagonosporopsis vannaccii]|nr:C6 transcription factor [Stagonosporopsis vannaccii]
MASKALRTCVRCHHKKIRCSGYPECENCLHTHIDCQLYQRQRYKGSAEALKYYKERACWLEEEIRQHLGVSCADVTTGTSLRPNVPAHTDPPAPAEDLQLPPPDVGPQQALHILRSTESAPEASVVALNATGDMRFLGPSSGIFFALYASAFAQLSGSGCENNRNNPDTGFGSDTDRDIDEDLPLSLETIRFLVQSYRIWIEPLYPILDSETVDALILKCLPIQVLNTSLTGRTNGEVVDLSIFYLVLALGSINQNSTVELMRNESFRSLDVSSALLYRKALKYINIAAQRSVPSIPFVQILLLFSIYSMHGPIATSQWQVVGSAMRLAVELGLHSSVHQSKLTDTAREERKRIFWTAYSLEISLAYNLGRPPSIGEEHITVELPTSSGKNAASLLHFKHRRIQSRIVAKVYGANCGVSNITDVQAQLQQELNEWKEEVSTLRHDDLIAYPHSFWIRLYHGTTFVLHRASPLCPNPTRESIRKCLESAGIYTENILHVLQRSHVPLSWMLVQGVLFAGLTMLVTARTSYAQLDPSTDLTLLLVDLPAWTRQCSICLAIMNERWHEPLLSKLTSQFETLVNDTLKYLTTALTQPQAASVPWQSAPAAPRIFKDWSKQGDFTQPDGWLNPGSHFELMRDVMGFDPDQNFWDTFPML